MIALPRVMVAPNGARRTKADHPMLPITISETVEAAKACFAAGAEGLHAHVRDKDGAHSLDIGRYRELLRRMQLEVPDMLAQVTTESVGVYSPSVQRDLLKRLRPAAASVAIREMLSDGDRKAAREAYCSALEAGTSIQHILYDERDIRSLKLATEDGTVPSDQMQALLVLGAYADNRPARIEELEPMLDLVKASLPEADLAVCAFGVKETAILREVLQRGGKIRVGFENNLHSENGSPATDNAARVIDVLSAR